MFKAEKSDKSLDMESHDSRYNLGKVSNESHANLREGVEEVATETFANGSSWPALIN